MSQERWLWSRTAQIPSHAPAAARYVRELVDQLKRHDWKEGDVFAVHLAVEEAMVNAIKHGNRYDPKKKVRLDFRLAADRVIIEIADEGAGFAPERIPDPTLDENLAAPCGRGVLLMRRFMTDVRFGNDGTRVIMEKVRSNGQA